MPNDDRTALYRRFSDLKLARLLADIAEDNLAMDPADRAALREAARRMAGSEEQGRRHASGPSPEIPHGQDLKP